MKTVVGLFRNTNAADGAVAALKEAGFTTADLSVLARDGVLEPAYAGVGDRSSYEGVGPAEGAGVGAAGGAVVGGITGLLMGIGAIAIPGIGPVIAAGTLATALGSALAGGAVGAAAGAVTGGIVAALVDLGVPEEDASFYAEGVKRGGVLVTVQTDESRASSAESIMRRSDALEVNSHREAWASEGWQDFDEITPPSRDYPLL